MVSYKRIHFNQKLRVCSFVMTTDVESCSWKVNNLHYAQKWPHVNSLVIGLQGTDLSISTKFWIIFFDPHGGCDSMLTGLAMNS